MPVDFASRAKSSQFREEGANMLRVGFSFALLMALSIGSVARADDWPQWRGPTLNGISTATELPEKWSATEGIAWKYKMPGPAGSTPVIAAGKLYATSAQGDDLVLLCLDLQGKLLWEQKLGTGNRVSRGDEGNMAAPSPSTDGERVWTFIGTGDLACHDSTGKLVWHRNLQTDYGKFEIQFGMTSTPLLFQGRLYLQLIHGEGDPKTREAKVVCLDALTGKEIWKQERPSEAHSENEHSYASPTLFTHDGQTYLLTHGADYAIAHRLDTGAEVWRTGDLHPPSKYDPTLRLVSSPVFNDGLIVIPSAKGGKVLALKPGGSGDITKAAEFRLWTHGRTPDVPSPLIYDGLVYLCREDGILICLDAKTGEKLYEQRTQPDRHRASPFYGAGKVYVTARNGTTTVVKAGRKFELISSNSLGESTAASPAVANGMIFIRTFETLYAIDGK
jgi:outer membrane protein assembly factor BamB